MEKPYVEVFNDSDVAEHYVEVLASEPMVDELLKHKHDHKTFMQRLTDWFS